jgi:hypothetical protein
MRICAVRVRHGAVASLGRYRDLRLMLMSGYTIKVCRYHDWCRDPTTVLRGVIEAASWGLLERHIACSISFSLQYYLACAAGDRGVP